MRHAIELCFEQGAQLRLHSQGPLGVARAYALKKIRPLVAQGRIPGAAESQFGVRAWCAGQEIRIAHGVGPMDDVPIVQKKPVK
ncbi:MAG: hypothetical protein PWQ64_700 [Desulfomicrobiaceae bacterium]|nr:hypothetical protein [Desulfomicrobiaceae bacterium]